MVAEYHMNDKYLGAEFWVQIRKGGGDREDSSAPEGLEFHFDKDEKAADELDQWHHPIVSTATYIDLCDSVFPAGGCPLVIFNTRSDDENYGAGPIPLQAWVAFPAVNRHVAFDGNALHGIPADLLPHICDSDKPTNYSRASILVNIWVDHKPLGVERLHGELVQQQDGIATEQATGNEFKPLREVEVTPVKAVISKKRARDLYFLKEHRDGDTGPLPLQELRQEYSKFSAANQDCEVSKSSRGRKRRHLDCSNSSSILQISYVSAV
jgi:hypothetical protein